MTSEATPPEDQTLVIWGDYNTVGLSGEEDDNCIYSLDREALDSIDVKEGKTFFIF